MMAPDHAPPPPALAQETLDALHRELTRYLRDASHTPDLHDVLCRMSEEAHAKAIRAEQLLIVLKQVWYAVLDERQIRTKEEREELLRQVITRCIEEYYAK